MKITVMFASGGRTVDAVADHARLLAGALRDRGEDAVALDRHGGWTPEDGPRLSLGSRGARKTIRRSDWVIVSYSPFGMARWGFAPWLLMWTYYAAWRSRVLMFVHEPYLAEGRGHQWLISRWQRLQLRMLMRSASAAAAPIERWTDLLTEMAPGLPIAHVPVGSNLPDRRDGRQALRADLGAENRFVVAIFSNGHDSRLDSHVSGALEALAEARADLLVLNLGAEAKPVESPVGVEVLCPGWLSAVDLAEHLAAADMLIAPLVDGASTRRTTIAAALQHGIPVISTCGDLTDSELASSDSGIFLVDVIDPGAFARTAAMLSLNESQRRQLGKQARKRYDARWSWPTIARAVLELMGTNQSTCLVRKEPLKSLTRRS